MKKLFTLIELIVVIVVIGVLAAIVIPNISSMKEEAVGTAITNDTGNIQIAVDMQQLKGEGLPTTNPVELGKPQEVDFDELTPKYLRVKPKQGKFWIDHNKIVYGSTVGLPSDVSVSEEGEVSWTADTNATQHEVFKIKGETQSSAMKQKLVSIEKINGTTFIDEEYKKGDEYLIASQDKYGNWTPAANGDLIQAEDNNEGENQIPEEPEQPESELEQLALGDYVEFGEYNGHKILWNVVKKENDKVMLFMTEPIKGTNGSYLSRSFDVSPNAGEPRDTNRDRYGSNNYIHSDIREWLNGDFYNSAFEDKSIIADTTHDYILAGIDSAQATSGNTNHIYNSTFSNSLQNYKTTAFKNTVTDKVFLVSIDELVNNIQPEIGSNYYNSSYWYWTRDSYAANSYPVRYVYTDGNVHRYNANYASGRVRAALSLESGVLKSGDGKSIESAYVIE